MSIDFINFRLEVDNNIIICYWLIVNCLHAFKRLLKQLCYECRLYVTSPATSSAIRWFTHLLSFKSFPLSNIKKKNVCVKWKTCNDTYTYYKVAALLTCTPSRQTCKNRRTIECFTKIFLFFFCYCCYFSDKEMK